MPTPVNVTYRCGRSDGTRCSSASPPGSCRPDTPSLRLLEIETALKAAEGREERDDCALPLLEGSTHGDAGRIDGATWSWGCPYAHRRMDAR